MPVLLWGKDPKMFYHECVVCHERVIVNFVSFAVKMCRRRRRRRVTAAAPKAQQALSVIPSPNPCRNSRYILMV